MTPDGTAEETPYERNQRFNPLLAWIHSARYNAVLELLAAAGRGELPCRSLGEPIRVVDIGCAHAKLFSVLNRRFSIDYTGLEIDGSYADTVERRYGNCANFHFVAASAVDWLRVMPDMNGEGVVFALESLEHIGNGVERDIVKTVAAKRPALFVCSFPVEVGPAVWAKNLVSAATGYSRHHEYSWTETLWAGLYRFDKLPPHANGHKGFDWRRMVRMIADDLDIVTMRRLPFAFLPAALSSSIFIAAVCRR